MTNYSSKLMLCFTSICRLTVLRSPSKPIRDRVTLLPVAASKIFFAGERVSLAIQCTRALNLFYNSKTNHAISE